MLRPGLYLTGFKNIQLTPLIPQGILLNYTSWLMTSAYCSTNKITSLDEFNKILMETKAKMERFGVSENQIYQRQFVSFPKALAASDSGKIQFDQYPLFHQDLAINPHGDNLSKRLNVYGERVNEAFDQFYEDEKTLPPTDIVHVTCAGYLSPSPAQEFIVRNAWTNKTQVTHSYHMGCYGAFPAVRIACGILAAAGTRKKIDVVHTEFLSIHFDPTQISPLNLINMTLFADGFSKYEIVGEADFKERPSPVGFKVIAQHEEIIPNTLDEMTWIPGPNHFDMYLSRDVPKIIGENVRQFVDTLCEKAGLADFDKKKIVYAIHPGGPKVLSQVKESLNLENEHIRFSQDVLQRYGNMSSATIPHIWKEILDSKEVQKGTIVLSMGFGPGLTATGYIFEKTT